jgi:hypothetical protein
MARAKALPQRSERGTGTTWAWAVAAAITYARLFRVCAVFRSLLLSTQENQMWQDFT